jgi:hypothetical protein
MEAPRHRQYAAALEEDDDDHMLAYRTKNDKPEVVPLPGHIVSFDGLRAVACIFTQLHHIELKQSFSGHYGVSMFLVLSGFLISGILVNLKVSVRRIHALFS